MLIKTTVGIYPTVILIKNILPGVLDLLHAHRVSPSWHRHCRFHLFAIRTSSSAASSVHKSARLSLNVASRLNLQKRIFLLHIKKYSPGCGVLLAGVKRVCGCRLQWLCHFAAKPSPSAGSRLNLKQGSALWFSPNVKEHMV